MIRCRVDGDGDGYGIGGRVSVCPASGGGCPVGYSSTSGDCNDVVRTINPGATEICNGVSDDCDGTIDSDHPDFDCEQASIVECVVPVCRTTGHRWCDSDCEWISRGGETCYALHETCNYCDDNALADIADERALATGTHSQFITDCSDDSWRDSDSRCSGDNWIYIVDNTWEAGGFRALPDVTVGYGPVTIWAYVDAQCGGSEESPADGWAIVAYRGTGTFIGARGNNLGVNRSRYGYAAEWFFYTDPASFTNSTDRSRFSELRGPWASENHLGPSAYPSLDRGETTYHQQGLRMVIHPDIPGTEENEMRVDVYRTTGGGSYVNGCRGSACYAQIEPGDNLQVGITAGTGGARARIRAYVGYSEAGFSVRAEEVCE